MGVRIGFVACAWLIGWLFAPGGNAVAESVGDGLRAMRQELTAGRLQLAAERGERLLASAEGRTASPAEEEALRRMTAKALLGLNRFADAERHLERALALAPETAAAPLSLDAAETLSLLAKARSGLGKSADAVAQLRALVDRLKSERPNDKVEIAEALYDLGTVLMDDSKLDDAEAALQAALEMRHQSAAGDRDRAGMARNFNSLGNVRWMRGQHREAKPFYEQAIALLDTPDYAHNPDLATMLSNYGAALVELGLFQAAVPNYERALVIRERSLGSSSYAVSIVLNNLGNAYRELGRVTDSEKALNKALAVRERAVGPNHPSIATVLNNLGLTYVALGRDSEVEAVYQRAVDLLRPRADAGMRGLGQILINLGRLQLREGRIGEAQRALQEALGISIAARGTRQHPEVATALNYLGLTQIEAGQYAEAADNLRQGLEIRRSLLGDDNTHTGLAYGRLAEALHLLGQSAEAERLLRRNLEIQTLSLGPDHPSTAIAQRQLGSILLARGNLAEALVSLRGAARLQRKMPDILPRQTVTLDGGNESRLAFSELLRAAWLLSRSDPASAEPLADEAFRAAQWAGRSLAAIALAKMGARAAAGRGLGELVRRAQDLNDLHDAVTRRYMAALGLPSAEQDEQRLAALRAEAEQTQRELAGLSARIAQEFPQYSKLAIPEPLAIADVQGELSDDEALLLIAHAEKRPGVAEETYVWVITRSNARWAQLAGDAMPLTERVQRLRCGLDGNHGWDGFSAQCPRLVGRWARGEPLPFDLDLAYGLYRDLLGPFEDLIAGKHLLTVSSAVLAGLPLQVLVSAPPAAARPRDFTGYRTVAWLGTRQPMTTLPSVSSLRGLRSYAGSSAGRRAYLGYGNPTLQGGPDCRTGWMPQGCTPVRMVADRGIGRQFSVTRSTTIDDVYRRGPDPTAVLAAVRAQCPLPATELEVQCVAQSIGAAQSDMRLLFGPAATERDIKERSISGELAEYRVLHFATHGLLAGSLSTLLYRQGEPALILTPPLVPLDADDDGLLTASEISQLKLDADWVILSACDTAGGDAPGSEALSGLARAFFYAGARTLMVSHWPVDSGAAVQLVDRTFAEMRDDRNLGRAEAFRRALKALTQDTSMPDNGHPSIWAPFVLVGEGAARHR